MSSGTADYSLKKTWNTENIQIWGYGQPTKPLKNEQFKCR